MCLLLNYYIFLCVVQGTVWYRHSCDVGDIFNILLLVKMGVNLVKFVIRRPVLRIPTGQQLGRVSPPDVPFS